MRTQFPLEPYLDYYKPLIPILVACCILFSCKEPQKKPPEVVEVKVPEKIDAKVKELLQENLAYAETHDGGLNDSIRLKQVGWLKTIYSERDFQPLWSGNEEWTQLADSLYIFIVSGRRYGLFPSDYHSTYLTTARSGMLADSLHRKNAALWARADILFTDAYLQMARDLCLGRLERDSISQRTDTAYTYSFFIQNLKTALETKTIKTKLEELEPKLKGYQDLKAAISRFLDSASFKPVTTVVYPNKDSALLMKQVNARLDELDYPSIPGDSASLRQNIRKYQKDHNITVTGKIGEITATSLNNTDWWKFKRIAANLDRYKLMADTLPHQYIWVNLPSYTMELWNDDTVAIESKIVVGKPLTRTPLLTSRITDMVTYPLWTIPESIILKEVLPGLQKDTNYLRKKGYSLLNFEGDEVSTSTVNWKKYKTGIPYKVVQGSGDDNALGVLKFNFSNKYSVYMHDTNQRYYFGRTVRALSHGCVRVQQWDKLARFIIANDSVNAAPNVNTFKTDTLKAWLVRKEKHVIPVRTRIPVYIRYFGCSANNGKLKFFDDIYGEDRLLLDRYFSEKVPN